MQYVYNFIINIISNNIIIFISGALFGYLLDRMFDWISNKLKIIPMQVKRKKVEEYNKSLQEKEFEYFKTEVLLNIYGDRFFTKINNQKFPIFIENNIRASWPFKNLTKDNYLFFSYKEAFDEEFKKLDAGLKKLQKEYRYLVSDNIHRPKMQGYMFKDYVYCNDNPKNIIGFNSFVATYEDNIFTSHILEYELLKLYKGGINPKDVKLKDLKFRDFVHNDDSIENVLITGKNRYSLLSVYLIISFYDPEIDDYRVLGMTRSQNVATGPGFFQFVPAGGFEVFDYETKLSQDTLKENYDLVLAVFREYLEELIMKPNDKTFEFGQGGETINHLKNHKGVKEINEYIKNNMAEMVFLGDVIDLSNLRHELTFALRIDDETFSEKIFYANHEGTNIERLTYDGVDKKMKGPKVTLACRGQWELFKNHDISKRRK